MGRPKRARLPPPNLQASKGGRLKIQLPTAHGTLGGPCSSVRPSASAAGRGDAWAGGARSRRRGHSGGCEAAARSGPGGDPGERGRHGQRPWGDTPQNGKEASVAERMGGPELRAEAPRREAKGWGGERARPPLSLTERSHR